MKDDRGDLDLTKQLETQEKELKTLNDVVVNLKNIIDDSNLNFNEIKNLYFFPSGRWDVEIHTGTLIRLPKKQLKRYFDLSLKILNDQKFKGTKLIDVRQVDQVIIDGWRSFFRGIFIY